MKRCSIYKKQIRSIYQLFARLYYYNMIILNLKKVYKYFFRPEKQIKPGDNIKNNKLVNKAL